MKKVLMAVAALLSIVTTFALAAPAKATTYTGHTCYTYSVTPGTTNGSTGSPYTCTVYSYETINGTPTGFTYVGSEALFCAQATAQSATLWNCGSTKPRAVEGYHDGYSTGTGNDLLVSWERPNCTYLVPSCPVYGYLIEVREQGDPYVLDSMLVVGGTEHLFDLPTGGITVEATVTTIFQNPRTSGLEVYGSAVSPSIFIG